MDTAFGHGQPRTDWLAREPSSHTAPAAITYSTVPHRVAAFAVTHSRWLGSCSVLGGFIKPPLPSGDADVGAAGLLVPFSRERRRRRVGAVGKRVLCAFPRTLWARSVRPQVRPLPHAQRAASCGIQIGGLGRVDGSASGLQHVQCLAKTCAPSMRSVEHIQWGVAPRAPVQGRCRATDGRDRQKETRRDD
jgi:hypothetical protein